MATMNISLPDQMKSWVESQTQDGRYSNASDYVRDLIRRDRERTESIRELNVLIQEGLDSGISERSVEDIWQEAVGIFEAENARKQA